MPVRHLLLGELVNGLRLHGSRDVEREPVCGVATRRAVFGMMDVIGDGLTYGIGSVAASRRARAPSPVPDRS